jgi:hypothetical protein
MFGVLILIMIGSYLFFQLAVWVLETVTPPGATN